MSIRKLFLTLILLSLTLTGLQAQKGFSLGPAIGFGVGYSKNFILDDTSQNYIKSGIGLYGHGGLDLAFGVNDNVSFIAGGQFRYKQFTLSPPEQPADLSFTKITRAVTSISIPMMVSYRFKLGGSESTWMRIMAGHSLDIISGDSTVLKTPSTGIADSAGSFIRHQFQIIDGKIPTVLLGAGVDLQSASGNVLNISLMWGLGTGKIFQGNIKEWAFLNRAFDTQNPDKDEPEEFPEHYYEFAMRGSTISVRLSYRFALGKKGESEEVKTPKEEEDKAIDIWEEDEPKEEKPKEDAPEKDQPEDPKPEDKADDGGDDE